MKQFSLHVNSMFININQQIREKETELNGQKSQV